MSTATANTAPGMKDQHRRMRPLSPGFLATRLLVGAIGAAGCAGAGGREADEAGDHRAPPRPAQRFELVESSITDLQRALSSGQVTSQALVAMYQARIAAYDTGGPELNAVSVQNRRAADEASALDAQRRARRVRGPLHGIPIIVKDNVETSTMQTAAGSRALAGYIPGRDAFVTRCCAGTSCDGPCMSRWSGTTSTCWRSRRTECRPNR